MVCDGVRVGGRRPVLQQLSDGLRYTQVAAGFEHTVLVRSDGTALTSGSNLKRQCDVPCLDCGLTYLQAAAGMDHTVLLRSDGRVVACGSNRYGQCDVPTLTDGLHYIPAAAGAGALNPAMLQSRLLHKSVALQSTPPHNPVVL